MNHFFRIMGFGFMLYLQWEAMLISYLARRVINVPFDGISTLVTATDFKITLMPGTSIEDAFKTSTDPFWQKAWTDRIEPFLDGYKSYYGNISKFQQRFDFLNFICFSLQRHLLMSTYQWKTLMWPCMIPTLQQCKLESSILEHLFQCKFTCFPFSDTLRNMCLANSLPFLDDMTSSPMHMDFKRTLHTCQFSTTT